MPERGTSTTALYQGPDAYAQQRDAWDIRRRQLPEAGTLVYGGDFLVNCHQNNNLGVSAANTTYWVLLRPLTADMELKEAMLRITAAKASHFCRTAFYRLAISGGQRSLVKVPGSVAEFRTDSGALVRVDVSGDLYVGNTYFLGFMCTDTFPAWRSATIFTSSFPLLRKTSTPELPDTQRIDELSATDVQSGVPLVQYLNPIAAEIW